MVGLDPHLALLPEEFAVARDPEAPRPERARAIGDFLCGIIDAAAGKVPAVKPQSAFFEVFGADGVAELERVVAASKDAGLLVIGDVKRGDIGSTAVPHGGLPARHRRPGPPYPLRFDHGDPYLGSDSVAPIIDECKDTGGGMYVLVRTSNPSSAEFQALPTGAAGAETAPLADRVASAVDHWGLDLKGASGWSSVGAVVGATHPRSSPGCAA